MNDENACDLCGKEIPEGETACEGCLAEIHKDMD